MSHSKISARADSQRRKRQSVSCAVRARSLCGLRLGGSEEASVIQLIEILVVDCVCGSEWMSANQ